MKWRDWVLVITLGALVVWTFVSFVFIVLMATGVADVTF
jgi:hypothetical protein